MAVGWDVVEPTDAGILETLSKKVIRDGEKRLMLAMLESVTEDFQKYALATDKKGKELFDAAEEFSGGDVRNADFVGRGSARHDAAF